MTAPKLTASQRRELAQYTPEAERQRRERRRELLLELQAQGWSLRQLAEMLGVKHPQVVQWMQYDRPQEQSTGDGKNY